MSNGRGSACEALGRVGGGVVELVSREWVERRRKGSSWDVLQNLQDPHADKGLPGSWESAHGFGFRRSGNNNSKV